MIGVIADPAEADVVREFFELFKTPWEFYRRDQRVRRFALRGRLADLKELPNSSSYTPEEKRVWTINRISKPPVSSSHARSSLTGKAGSRSTEMSLLLLSRESRC